MWMMLATALVQWEHDLAVEDQRRIEHALRREERQAEERRLWGSTGSAQKAAAALRASRNLTPDAVAAAPAVDATAPTLTSPSIATACCSTRVLAEGCR